MKWFLYCNFVLISSINPSISQKVMFYNSRFLCGKGVASHEGNLEGCDGHFYIRWKVYSWSTDKPNTARIYNIPWVQVSKFYTSLNSWRLYLRQAKRNVINSEAVGLSVTLANSYYISSLTRYVWPETVTIS